MNQATTPLTRSVSRPATVVDAVQAAIEVAAAATQLHADLEAVAALRKAQGRPSFEEETADDKAYFRELVAEGWPLDLEVVAWALSD